MIITNDEPADALEEVVHDSLQRMKENLFKGLPHYKAPEGRENERETDWFVTYMSNITLNMLYLTCSQSDPDAFLKRASIINRVLHDVTRHSIQEVAEEMKSAPLIH